MAARVQGGSLGRWFEQLCRIRYPQLLQVAAPNRSMLKTGLLPHQDRTTDSLRGMKALNQHTRTTQAESRAVQGRFAWRRSG